MNGILRALRSRIALPGDDQKEITRKVTFIIFGTLMSMGGIVWGALCLVFGLYLSAIIPFAYTVIVGFCIVVFILTRRYYLVSRIQLLLSLLLPFFLQWSLGGFKKSGVVMYWAIIAPLAAQFFGGLRLSRIWIAGFLLLTAFSGIIDPMVVEFTGLPDYTHVPAFVINLTLVSFFVILASQYFYTQMIENEDKLSDSLRLVSDLKHQQDGDYYLTSLLVSPLITNNIHSPNISVEFFIRQKKQFKFKSITGEIGGDFCAAEFISLRNRRFAVLMNADAMGKSIQGAGGALVVGTILHLLFERTRRMEDYGNMLPERWLKNAYTELNSAFETLDGRMQISFILALYDEQSGVLYKINVEHPQAVLMRQETPAYIANRQMLSKLGSGMPSRTLAVDMFQLAAGDTVYFGSDGKDDVLLRHEGEENIYNIDENFFLRHVSASQGNLDELFRNATSSGNVIDDYSVVKLQIEDVPAARTEHAINLSAELSALGIAGWTDLPDSAYFKRALKLLLKQKDFEKAYHVAEIATREYPMNESFVLAASYTSRKLGLFDRAIDYGESLILRGFDSPQVHLNLARSYLAIGQAQRSRHYYEQMPESLKWHKSTHVLRGKLYPEKDQ